MSERFHHRGDQGAYERYLAGMDASMRQKVALTAAHLLGAGTVADMGMGSGAGSCALASLYPGLEVIGVDLDPTMVELARERYQLPNLSFAVGDITRDVFGPESLDGVFDSSVLHHVTTFGGYDHQAAARTIEVQARQLRFGGVLVVRDFVRPEPGAVVLELPAGDGDDSCDPRTCSTAALFERFAGEFRALSDARGFPFEALEPATSSWRRYRCDRVHAAEFLLRKDYRTDWEAEVEEEYTYFTQAQFEEVFARAGLRLLASTPIRNPWIVAHRFEGRYRMTAESGAAEDHPATNIIVVGQRIAADEAVGFRAGEPTRGSGFLGLTQHRRQTTGEVRDLVRRRRRTLDIVPWFEADGDLLVLARAGYPRPVLVAPTGLDAALDGARPIPWNVEPIALLEGPDPLGTTIEAALRERAGVGADSIRGMRPGTTYYPSAGGILEEVRSTFVQIDAVFVTTGPLHPLGFRSTGWVRAIDALELLRAGQVGGLADARLELNTYQLLTLLERRAGPWIGAEIALAPLDELPGVTTLATLATRPARRQWTAAPLSDSPGFLAVRARQFHEIDRMGETIAHRPIEYAVPCTRSVCTVACVVLARFDGRVWIGLDDDDLPAAQAFSGQSEILVTPAWRIPNDIASLEPAKRFCTERLAAQHGVAAGRVFDLGGRYHPTPGLTPEVVHPIAVEVAAVSGAPPLPLHFVPLAEAITRTDLLVDGHLRVVAHRAAHALGLC